MIAVQTTQAGLAEFSRCGDQSRLSVEEQNVDHKADKADASITEKVDRALWKVDVLRSTDYEEIDIHVKDRIVFLSGHVITTNNKTLAEAAARTISGVQGVMSDLVPDDKLKREVAGALGKIEHEYGVKFFTGAQNGVIVLNGEVGSTNVRALAEKCAASIPGIRGVINSVRSPEVDLQTEDKRFLQPVIGEQIYFRDGLLGNVQRVIIDPNNRRVVAMIVQRQITTHQSAFESLMGGNTLLPEGLVIIPMNLILYMTKSSGVLHIHSAETARYSNFDPSFFIAPGKDWTPPYPYCTDEVLFPVAFNDELNRTESEPVVLPAMVPSIQPVIQNKVSGVTESLYASLHAILPSLNLRIWRNDRRTINS